jgi:hypothetical protein
MGESLDQDVSSWSSLGNSSQQHMQQAPQLPANYNIGILAQRSRSSSGNPRHGRHTNFSGDFVRQGASAMLQTVPQSMPVRDQEARTKSRISSEPQTKFQQQKMASKRSRYQASEKCKASSISHSVDLEAALRVLTGSAPEEEASKAFRAISDLIKEHSKMARTAQRRADRGEKVCPKCPYTVTRDCDLRKHLKRHKKPYGCTYPRCSKRFGAKSDWKRHENSQHFQQEAFRCAHPLPSGAICGVYLHRKDLLKQHLQVKHKRLPPDRLEEELDRSTIGKNYQGSFWCGFCNQVIQLQQKTNAAWDERFDHIARHFEKEDKSIDGWVCAEENRTKGERVKERNRHDSDESDEKDDMDAVGEEDDDVPIPPTVTEQATMHVTLGPLPEPLLGGPSLGKRKRTAMGSSTLEKRQRTVVTRLCVGSCQASTRINADTISANARRALGNNLSMCPANIANTHCAIIVYKMYFLSTWKVGFDIRG